MRTRGRRISAPRFTPVLGALIGALGGGVYWLGVQIWPASIAVVLSMLATALLSTGWAAQTGTDASTRERAEGLGLLGLVFTVLVKYNALMALSAAKLPFAFPANLALGLIMVAGYAASRALLVKPTAHSDLVIALALGFAPAALLGIPGLIGLAAAIVARIVFIAYARRSRVSTATVQDAGQQLTEICFYLGALATWAYV